jgi:cation diffusion facilitator family transporter
LSNLFSNFLVNRFIKNHEKTADPLVRSQYGVLEGWISIFINLFLGIIKIVIALIYGSIALLADAIHTLSDMATSVIIIIGFKISKKPGDKEHPFGHGRMEQIATLIVAILLAVSAIELIQYSIKKIMSPQPVAMDWIPIIIIFLTIFFKEWLGQFSKYLGKKIGSLALEADAWHHRSDAISSLLVVFALIASKYGFNYFDGIAGLVIGAYIIYLGWDIAKKSINQLLGESADESLIDEITNIVMEEDKVKNVHDLIVHQYGEQKLLSLHMEVPANLSLSEAHTIADNIENIIEKKLNIYTTIHLDPVMPASPESLQIESIINDFIRNDERIESFHDLRLIGEKNYSNLLFDLVVKRDLKSIEKKEIKKSLCEKISMLIPAIKDIQIKYERSFL